MLFNIRTHLLIDFKIGDEAAMVAIQEYLDNRNSIKLSDSIHLLSSMRKIKKVKDNLPSPLVRKVFDNEKDKLLIFHINVGCSYKFQRDDGEVGFRWDEKKLW